MRWWKHLVVPDILTTYHEVVRALNHRRMPRPVFWLKEIELRVVKDHSVIGYGIVITPSPPKLMMDIHGDYRMDCRTALSGPSPVQLSGDYIWY